MIDDVEILMITVDHGDDNDGDDDDDGYCDDGEMMIDDR